MPSSPANVRPVREVAGEEIYQSYVGSSANPGYRDFAVAAEIVKDKAVHPRVSFDINPTSRQILENLARHGHVTTLLHAGARLHQAGCNGCIGMGQAPATDVISLRTVPRNFPGRSGTYEDKVCLVSPETAAASALTGVITDPRSLDMPYPRIEEPEDTVINTAMLVAPPPPGEAPPVNLRKGPNIASLPDFPPLADAIEAPVLLKAYDDISTDEILRAGTEVLPFRSNIPEISRFSFDVVDRTYSERARAQRDKGGHIVVGGRNYGQGSSREHAALAPRYLGLQAVIAVSFARIHWQNLVNFGVLPLTFADPDERDRVEQGDVLRLQGIHDALQDERDIAVENVTKGYTFQVNHTLSPRQINVLLAGGLINWMKARLQDRPGADTDESEPDASPATARERRRKKNA
jgi:aconitate hydratase